MSRRRTHIDDILDDPWVQGERARKRAADRGRGPKPVGCLISGPLDRLLANGPEVPDGNARIVACRTCEAPVELSGFAARVSEQVNALLKLKGSAPQTDHELIDCPDCRVKREAEQEITSNLAHEKALELLAESRRTCTPISPHGKRWLKNQGYDVPPDPDPGD
jgi:hypothetical protein